MTSKREYPEQPLVGVGGVVIDNERALLIRRGGPPMEGQWSIPGGMLGSHLSTRVPVLWLRRILCTVLLMTGARMLWA